MMLLLKLDLCAIIWLILENIPSATEKNVYSLSKYN